MSRGNALVAGVVLIGMLSTLSIAVQTANLKVESKAQVAGAKFAAAEQKDAMKCVEGFAYHTTQDKAKKITVSCASNNTGGGCFPNPSSDQRAAYTKNGADPCLKVLDKAKDDAEKSHAAALKAKTGEPAPKECKALEKTCAYTKHCTEGAGCINITPTDKTTGLTSFPQGFTPTAAEGAALKDIVKKAEGGNPEAVKMMQNYLKDNPGLPKEYSDMMLPKTVEPKELTPAEKAAALEASHNDAKKKLEDLQKENVGLRDQYGALAEARAKIETEMQEKSGIEKAELQAMSEKLGKDAAEIQKRIGDTQFQIGSTQKELDKLKSTLATNTFLADKGLQEAQKAGTGEGWLTSAKEFAKDTAGAVGDFGNFAGDMGKAALDGTTKVAGAVGDAVGGATKAVADWWSGPPVSQGDALLAQMKYDEPFGAPATLMGDPPPKQDAIAQALAESKMYGEPATLGGEWLEAKQAASLKAEQEWQDLQTYVEKIPYGTGVGYPALDPAPEVAGYLGRSLSDPADKSVVADVAPKLRPAPDPVSVTKAANKSILYQPPAPPAYVPPAAALPASGNPFTDFAKQVAQVFSPAPTPPPAASAQPVQAPPSQQAALQPSSPSFSNAPLSPSSQVSLQPQSQTLAQPLMLTPQLCSYNDVSSGQLCFSPSLSPTAPPQLCLPGDVLSKSCYRATPAALPPIAI